MRFIKDNKFFIIVLSSLIIMIIILFMVLNSKVSFSLNGDSTITIEYGSIFEDPLYTAKNGLGKNISSYVTKEGYVDSNNEGVYTLKYTINYNNYSEELTRTIIVKSSDDYTIVLNGESTEYVLLNVLYQDKGAYVINNRTNEKRSISSSFSNVDTNYVGEYQVKYTYNGKDKYRKVIVFDVDYSISKNDSSTLITIDTSNINEYFYALLPDGSYSYDKIIKYNVNKKGVYSFVFYDRYKNTLQKDITINDNFYELSCTANINNDGTYLELSGPSSKSFSKVKWKVNNKDIIGSSSLKINNTISSAKAYVTYDNGDESIVNCSIKDNLAYHFKYDEYNTKKYMSCNSYTLEDKYRLEGMLAEAIRNAGYGSRAGVVEAARFIVGALDYKIVYLGPKSENYNLGRYPYVGLNIGNNTSWGCNVNGYVQGIDCTNFIYWAFIQNGINRGNLYDTNNVYKTRDIVFSLQVGDTLLTPCVGNCQSAFMHIGIIIGIDDNYIYVAEAATGDINATIVSKWNKFNMPSKEKFSMARKEKYSVEGNVTDMWLQELK